MIYQLVQVGSGVIAGAIGLYGAYQIMRGACKLFSDHTGGDVQDHGEFINAWKFSQKNAVGRSQHLPPTRCTTLRVVRTEEDCKAAVEEIRQHCSEYPVVAIDCEWNNTIGRCPVALLQLATQQGLCVLIRLCLIDNIPTELNDLLSDKKVLKVGDDAKRKLQYLHEDYKLVGNFVVDLADLARRCGVQPPYRVDHLAEKTFEVKMEWKQWLKSDWESTQLSKEQIKCATLDVRIGIELFKRYAETLFPRSARLNQKAWILPVVKTLVETEGRRNQ